MLKISLSENVANLQRQFFATGKTLNLDFRIAQLKILKQAILDNEEEIFGALKADLNKPHFETYLSEIFLAVKEIDYTIKHLAKWVKPRKISTPIAQFPATCKIYPEPLGVVLIIGAWNYPINLTILPLVGAIAAGNCAVIKPSEIAENSSHIIGKIISKYFDQSYITVVEGDKHTTQELINQKFDHILFTGSPTVGKMIMKAAAEHLTPVTLELGGKSPCIVEPNPNLEYTAKRIVWGKFINGGQTCIAPDYLLVNHQIKDQLIKQIKTCIQEFFGNNPSESPDYTRIINQKQFNRLSHLLSECKIIIGGAKNHEDLYIEPTLVECFNLENPLLNEEIFGPILPVVEYTELAEAIAYINSRPKPLALYFFSHDKNQQQQVLESTSSGGVSINYTMMHSTVPGLPFGGVGNSGTGAYHGKAGFDTFSHSKSVLQKPFWIDLSLLYPPYQDKIKWLKLLIRI
ncbi:aldehyde dehydrogenase [Merismopedia glauca]|uniref:Aldehyde dehydrogenase n=1 Tax=Merismopedia glauca CCAP 1448/3 TaxID=1296344 RepID=A0A2T1C0X0_9CYAN|nr:aldehyde dehydrogenase [Merismopedia glauca]PSB01773.1 aldehyde dehydrogenase family protein [Merismopedia glauca CCAP 1448/3]